MKQIALILLLMLIGFSSCSSDSEEFMIEEPLTEADLFVASKEFQNYQNFMKDDAKMMRKVLKGLPKSKRERFHELLDSLPKFKTLEQRDAILDEIGVLLKIDYKGRLYKIEKYTMDIRQTINFSNAELLGAMQKKNASETIPVFLNSTEERYEKCINNCDKLYDTGILGCPTDIWVPCPDENEDFIANDCEDYWACRSRIESELSSCYQECNRYY